MRRDGVHECRVGRRTVCRSGRWGMLVSETIWIDKSFLEAPGGFNTVVKVCRRGLKSNG